MVEEIATLLTMIEVFAANKCLSCEDKGFRTAQV